MQNTLSPFKGLECVIYPTSPPFEDAVLVTLNRGWELESRTTHNSGLLQQECVICPTSPPFEDAVLVTLNRGWEVESRTTQDSSLLQRGFPHHTAQKSRVWMTLQSSLPHLNPQPITCHTCIPPWLATSFGKASSGTLLRAYSLRALFPESPLPASRIYAFSIHKCIAVRKAVEGRTILLSGLLSKTNRRVSRDGTEKSLHTSDR